MAETTRKILCYGDSNTYGYDPRCFLGDRYPEERIWTTLLERSLNGRLSQAVPSDASANAGCPRIEVINRGTNGRKIPTGGWGYRYVESILEGLTAEDWLVIMLGSNDILMTDDPEAEGPVEKMDALLKWLSERENCPRILLIAPAYPDPDGLGGGSRAVRYVAASIKMNQGYRRLAERYGIAFSDAASWGIETAFDGVHYTEEGHAVFARHMEELFQDILQIK
ncbi:MAG: hypothetical protein IJU30_07675 [Lachnospiraceae bacterium]|nr:hypothetical protein [Lachnospiraceae bacterium]